ncbi:MAG TPA: GNAT family N-acetyltransferase [Anaerolineales bacterium]|nr:GNAT family N-acetyltransferase [Anaerolineales bacterium]
MMVSADNDPRRHGTIWMMDLDKEIPAISPRIHADFRRVTLDLAPALAASTDSLTLTEITKRLESGRQCYAVWVDGQVVAYGWVSFEKEDIGELNLRIKLLPGEAYIWDCMTLPAFREKLFYSAMLTYILSELRVQNLNRVWIGADLDNLPSQKGIARAGFRHVADLIIERVLAMRQVWVTGLSDVPESIVAEARRAFLNDRDKVWLNAVSSTTQENR